MLYYMGLLTLTDHPDRLRIPNLVVRKLFLDRLWPKKSTWRHVPALKSSDSGFTDRAIT